MIFVKGDSHGDLYAFSSAIFPEEKTLTGNDKVIFCGDFGFIFAPGKDKKAICREKKKLDILAHKPYEILFVDGNHENFNRLRHFPVVERYGGKARKIRDNIYQLMRGEIYTIEEKTFFVMGGAYSIDKKYRTEHDSWWKEELPDDKEYKNAANNLEKADFKVDYILSHTAPKEIIRLMGFDPEKKHMEKEIYYLYINDDTTIPITGYVPEGKDITDEMTVPSYAEDELKDIPAGTLVHITGNDSELTGFLDWVRCSTEFTHWYFGHWHEDRQITEKFTALYYDTAVIE